MILKNQKKNQKSKRNCLDAATLLLNRKAYFSWQLEKKLLGKEYTPEEVKITIDQCFNSLLLDDTLLFKYHIKDMQIEKKWGRFKIRHALLRKYLPQDIVEKMIQKYYSQEIEDKVKLFLTKKKEIDYCDLSACVREQKIRTFLYSRGF
ncbi:MAG: RecX family transcriptional regulator [Caldisericia bacterium]|nr:RecX family transcriptional regulator [Caldisericia bacterium]